MKDERKTASFLKEGLDYYIEGGKWVFTEKYHLDRGYCCQSGCRHCPYQEEDNSATQSSSY